MGTLALAPALALAQTNKTPPPAPVQEQTTPGTAKNAAPGQQPQPPAPTDRR